MAQANSLAACGASLVAGGNLVTKVYFPRLVMPLAAVGAGLMDLGVPTLATQSLESPPGCRRVALHPSPPQRFSRAFLHVRTCSPGAGASAEGGVRP